MTDIVQVPLTILQQQVQVSVTPGAPNVIREGAQEPSAKLSQMIQAVAADLLSSDLLMVSRPNVSTKATTIAALASFIAEVAVGATLLLEDANSIGKKTSELAAVVGKVNPAAVAPIVQAGENVKLRMDQLAAYMQAAKGAYTRAPEDLDYVGTSNAVGIANAAKLQALADEMSPENGGPGGIIYISGRLRLGAVRLHPAVHVWGSGRYGGRIEAIDNVPYTTGDRRINGVVTPDAPGEQRAVFYVVARAPYTIGQDIPTPATKAWVPTFCNLTIDGNKANQSGNWVAGIYAENGNSDPSFDEVAPDGNAKAYTGVWTYNVEVHDCSGTGIYNGPERQRAYLHATRSLNNGLVDESGNVITVANGFKIMGNDSIIGPRCGSGGNTDVAVEFNGCSGVSATQGNFWNGNIASENAATAFQVFGCNGIAVHGNVFNGNVYINSGSTAGVRRKPVVIVGNETRIADELFPDATPDGEPVGLQEPERNAFYTIAGYQQFICEGNGVSMSANNKRFKKLLWAKPSSGVGGVTARGTAKFTVNTDPAIKPFFDDIEDAIAVEAGGLVMWDIADVGTNRRYQNGTAVVAQGGGMLQVDGALGLKQVVQPMTEATALTLDGAGLCKLTAAAPLVALPMRMPVPRGDNQFVLVQFGQQVQLLTPSITPGQQDTPTDGGALQNVLLDLGLRTAPMRMKAGDTLAFVYKRASTTWELIGVWGAADPFQYKVRASDPGTYIRSLTSTYLPHSGSSPVGAGKEVAFDAGLYNMSEPMLVGTANSLTSPAMGTVLIQGTFSSTATTESGVVQIDTVRLNADDIVGRGVIRNLEIRGDAHTAPAVVTAKVHGIYAPDGPGEGMMHTLEFPRAGRVTGSALHVRGRDQLIMFRAKFSDARDWAIDAEDMGDSKWWGIGAKAGSGDPRCGTNPEFKSTGGAMRIAHCATFSLMQFDLFVDDETFGGKCVVLLEDQTNARLGFGEISGPCFIQGRNYQNGGNEYEINNNTFLNVLFKRAHGLPRVWTYDRPKGPSPITLSAYVMIEDADGPMFDTTKYGGIDPDNVTEMANRYDYLWQFTSQEGNGHTNMGYIHVRGSSGLFLRLSRPGDLKTQEVPFLVHWSNYPKRVHFVGFTPGALEDIPWDDANPPLTHVKAGVFGSGVAAVYTKAQYKWGYLLATLHNPGGPGTLTDGVLTFSVRPAPTPLPPGRAWALRVVPW